MASRVVRTPAEEQAIRDALARSKRPAYEQYEFTVVTELLTANAQRRMHYRVWGPVMSMARSSAYIMAKQAKIPKLVRAHIHVFPGQHRGVLADPGNHYPMAKAVIDGLVDASILEDDNGKSVECISLHAPQRTAQPQLRVVLVPVDRIGDTALHCE